METRISKLPLDNKGEFVVELLVKLMLALVLIYTFAQIVPIAMIHTNMSHAAEALARTVELTGQTDNSAEFQDQCTVYRNEWDWFADAESSIEIKPIHDVESDTQGWFSRSEKKLAFRETFTLEISYTYHMSILSTTLVKDDVGLDFPIKKTVRGTSEIYWKRS